MKVRSVIAALAVSAGLVAAPLAAYGATPQRFTVTDAVHGTIGTCGEGDLLQGDFERTQTVTLFSSGRGTLHLQMTGTITRTGTGTTGKYSERQRDFEFIEGSKRDVGLLGHLVVPGGPGFTFAGQARLEPDGTLSTTPGLTGLLDLNFEGTVCDALTPPRSIR